MQHGTISDLAYIENALTADDFIAFQRKMNWNQDAKETLEKSLSNTIFSVIAVKNNELVGMGRLIGDAVMYWYIQDIFILTDYQGLGIGTEIVKRLVQYVKESAIPKTGAGIYLMSAKGKEGFYERLGFKKRPNDSDGAGMEMEIYAN